jgi:hypothetical protein
MTNLQEIAFTRRLWANNQSEQQPDLVQSIVQRGRSAMRRYLYYSGGIATAALGFAMLITVLAMSYTSTPQVPGVSLAEVTELETPLYFQYAAEVAARQPEVQPSNVDSIESLSVAISPEIVPTREAVPPRAPLVSSGMRVNSVLNQVNITFYDCLNDGFCGHMYNGEQVYEGAAACSWNLAIGTAFYIVGDPTGRVYVCKDRGLLDDTWVDIFWNNPVDGYYWQSNIGRFGTIVLVALPE